MVFRTIRVCHSSGVEIIFLYRVFFSLKLIAEMRLML